MDPFMDHMNVDINQNKYKQTFKNVETLCHSKLVGKAAEKQCDVMKTGSREIVTSSKPASRASTISSKPKDKIGHDAIEAKEVKKHLW